MLRNSIKSVIILGLSASFVSSLIMMFVFYNLSFVSGSIHIVESNQMIAQLEAFIATAGLITNIFIIRYVLREV